MAEDAVHGVRFVGRISGRYTLPERPPLSGVSVFACRTQSLSPGETILSAPVSGSVGTPVSANLDHVGLIHGQISRHIDGGFAMVLDDERNDIDNVTARIDWLKKRRVAGIPDNRSHKRFIPRAAETHIVLADGQLLKCFIIDMSASGVAISMDFQPEIGTPLAVGSVVGRVVRHLDVGFAVKFAQVQDMEYLEARLVRSLEQLRGSSVA